MGNRLAFYVMSKHYDENFYSRFDNRIVLVVKISTLKNKVHFGPCF